MRLYRVPPSLALVRHHPFPPSGMMHPLWHTRHRAWAPGNLAKRSASFFTCPPPGDPLQSACHPASFLVETNLAIEPKEPLVAILDVEPQAEMEFPKAHGADVEGSGIALIEVIGSIHDASEEHTVGQREHMGRLVDQHPAASPEEKHRVTLPARLAVEHRVVSGETEDPNAIAKGCLAEDKIPRRVRVQILHGDGEDAEGISRKPFLDQFQDIASEYLPVARYGISSTSDLGSSDGQG